MRQAHLLLVAAALIGCSTVQEPEMPKYNQKPVAFKKKRTETASANYLLFRPADYKPRSSKRWPLILFLHGAGERGTNIWKVAAHGPPKIVKNDPNFPFIVVSPQCPPDQRWLPETLTALLDDVIRKHAVDTNRIYLTGLSMGGYGTWKLAMAHPERFAAIAPICGGGETIDVMLAGRQKAAALKSLGVWAFHGAKDPVVPVEESERMVSALERAGCADVQLTVYPEAMHDSWTETYDNPKLYEWFLAHRRNRR
jgi:predicted peptidase